MAKAYTFEAVRDFVEVVEVKWEAASGSAVHKPTRAEFPRKAGERFIVRGVEARKAWESDPNYRRVG